LSNGLAKQDTSNCHATYFPAEGKLLIPCIDVVDATGNVQAYRVVLEQLATADTQQFMVKEWFANPQDLTTPEESNCHATYLLESGKLLMPCVDVVDSSGKVESHDVVMRQVDSTLVELPKLEVTAVDNGEYVDDNRVDDSQTIDTLSNYESEEATSGTREKAISDENSDSDIMLFGHELVVYEKPDESEGPVMVGGDITVADFGVAYKDWKWDNVKVLKVAFDFKNYQYYPVVKNGTKTKRTAGRDTNTKPAALCQSTWTTSQCESEIIKNVLATAGMWTQSGKVDLSFQLTNNWNDAHIRFRFGTQETLAGTDGYSAVGKVSLTDKSKASIVLDENSYTFNASLLHEFGHAIGLAHEHQHPKSGYHWESADKIAKDLGWDKNKNWKDMVESFITTSGHDKLEGITKFDPKSIMSYSIPSSWVSPADNQNPQKCPAQGKTIGTKYCVEPKYKPVLSEGDKETAATLFPCTYSISATNQSFLSKGGSGSVNVSCSTNCMWTASSRVNWITITSGKSGKGNGTVKYSVLPNNSSVKRTGQLTIAGKTLTIIQPRK
jgi:hypothetical protein